MITTKIFSNRMNLISAVLMGAVALTGCASKSKSKDAGSSGTATDYGYNDSKKGGAGLGLLERIYFEFDKSEIGPDAVETLKKNAAVIKASVTMRVVVEGHCDDRGTAEYNIALGERRAKAGVNYLVSLGVPRSRLEMKSWGEEKPLDTAHTDAAYKLNRRDEFVILEK